MHRNGENASEMSERDAESAADRKRDIPVDQFTQFGKERNISMKGSHGG